MQLIEASEPYETGLALEVSRGAHTGSRVPLTRTALLLGRGAGRGETQDAHRIALEDPYLPRDHAALLWDRQQDAYRLHLLEGSLVTTRVLRAGQEVLVAARQPFLLQVDDEIVAGDSGVRIVTGA
jgi:hypothetical protein